MRKLIALAVAAQLAAGGGYSWASTPDGHAQSSIWRIVRTDEREFCDANVVIIDLRDGILRGSIGACDPDRNRPVKQVMLSADTSEITALREAVADLKGRKLVDASCEASLKSVPAMRMPGPETTITLGRGSRSVSVREGAPCLTDATRDLMTQVDQIVLPLRAQGLW